MGESACLMQQPFSYAAGIPSEAQEGNPLYALGQSVSFGRFMTEKLDWERWSTFSSHRRYVEEAESYARPGSVAQKRAFFEAHYKRLAEARKAAALLEQANNAASESATVPNAGDQGVQGSQAESVSGQEPEKIFAEARGATTFFEQAGNTAFHSATVPNSEHPGAQNSQMGFVSRHETENQEEVKKSEAKEVLTANESKTKNQEDVSVGGLKSNAKHNNLEAQRVLVENSKRVDRVNKVGSDNNGGRPIEEARQKEKHVQFEPLKKTRNINRKEEDISMEERRKIQMEKPAPETLNTIAEDSISRDSKTAKSKSQLKGENGFTPITKKSKTSLKSKHGTTPNSCQKSYSCTPVKEFNRLTSIIRKIDGSKGRSSSKTSKQSTTPLCTPNTPTWSAASKNLLATPLSAKSRGRIALDSLATERKTFRSRWHFFPTENGSFSPSCFTPFRLRTEERAARRKQKLEEKFKYSEVQKQQQETLKEKAGTDLRKLHQSLCFKARPLPSFYKERGASKDQAIKAPLGGHQSPIPERTAGRNRTSC